MLLRPWWHYALLLITCLSISHAATPTSFCKCTCFTNSTIITLVEASIPESISSNLSDETHSWTCADCNKQFCLSSDLAICKGATDDDVGTTCFQRDSAKDETVVFIFIIATGGLLAWAAVKPYLGHWLDNRRVRATYNPVDAGGGL